MNSGEPRRHNESSKWAKLLRELPPMRALSRGRGNARARARELEMFEYGFAKLVLQELDSMRPRAIYERPADVPEDDDAAYALLRAARGHKAGQSQRAAARALGAWLYEVACGEGSDAATLGVLITAYRGLLAADNDADRQWAERVRAHVRKWWKCDIADAPADVLGVRTWCLHSARRRDLVATWLLNGEPPPASGKFSPKAHDPDPTKPARGSRKIETDELPF